MADLAQEEQEQLQQQPISPGVEEGLMHGQDSEGIDAGAGAGEAGTSAFSSGRDEVDLEAGDDAAAYPEEDEEDDDEDRRDRRDDEDLRRRGKQEQGSAATNEEGAGSETQLPSDNNSRGYSNGNGRSHRDRAPRSGGQDPLRFGKHDPNARIDGTLTVDGPEVCRNCCCCH
jgi:hypothetical protein